jgi:molybdate/tungstate transport system ATP-binding protein
MSVLSIKNLTHKVDDFALKDIDLEINQGEYFVLLGPSGSGKTTLLETIAGLTSSRGEIKFGNELISNKSPEKRDIGFVYQDFALFPNLNVSQNIKFCERYKKEIKSKQFFDELIDTLNIKHLLNRPIGELSGGEKQRVALARALYAKSKILLLDEPLSAIDPTFKYQIIKQLKELHKHYHLTTIHVTHNFREASYLADKIAIIINGEIKQIGTPNDVLTKPKDLQIAKFLGYKNVFSTSILEIETKHRYFSINPNLIKIYQNLQDNQTDFYFDGVIEEYIWDTDHLKLYVKVNSNRFFIKIPKIVLEDFQMQTDQKIRLGFDKKDIYYL